MQPLSYTTLDKPLTDAVLGALPTTITGGSVSFFASITFLFIASYVIITVVTGGKLVQEGARKMTGNPYDIKESTEGIKRISFTYLILLSLVLIFMTINPDIISGNIGLEKLEIDGKTVLGTRLPVREGAPVAPASASSTTPAPTDPSYEARLKSHKENYAQLAQYGITTNHDGLPCTEAQFKQTTPSCTSLSYYSQDAINMLISLKDACRCDIMVTGATEPGHAKGGSHREGGRGTDLRISNSQSSSDPLLNFLRTNGTAGGGTNVCYSTYLWNGFRFCDEKPLGNSSWAPHLHVE